MHSFQSEDDCYFTHTMTAAHSESLGQGARKFPYDYSYDTCTSGNDRFVPHPPLHGKKKLLQRTQSNPEARTSQMNHLPALNDKKATLRIGKTDQTSLGMAVSRPTEGVSILTAKMPRTVPGKLPESSVSENVCCRSTVDTGRNTHRKLERSKTTPVSFLKPLQKTSSIDPRRRVQLSTMNPRGYSMEEEQNNPCRSHNITTNYCRSPCEIEGRIYGTTDTESQGLFKQVEKTYGSPPMTRALPNGRRFGTAGRMEDREDQQTNTTPPPPKIRTDNGVKEKRVQTQGKFTRTGQFTADLQFLDSHDEQRVLVGQESQDQQINFEESQELTYLRFTKERQEDNRI